MKTEGMINEKSWEDWRGGQISWKNNIIDRKMSPGKGLLAVGTFNYRHTNTPVCMETPVNNV